MSEQAGPTPPSKPTLTKKRFLVRFKNGGEAGPMPAAQLQSLAESGKLGREDLVAVEGHGRWVAASKVGGLFTEQAVASLNEPADSVLDTTPAKGRGRPRLAVMAGILTVVVLALGATVVNQVVRGDRVESVLAESLSGEEQHIENGTQVTTASPSADGNTRDGMLKQFADRHAAGDFRHGLRVGEGEDDFSGKVKVWLRMDVDVVTAPDSPTNRAVSLGRVFFRADFDPSEFQADAMGDLPVSIQFLLQSEALFADGVYQRRDSEPATKVSLGDFQVDGDLSAAGPVFDGHTGPVYGYAAVVPLSSLLEEVQPNEVSWWLKRYTKFDFSEQQQEAIRQFLGAIRSRLQ